MTNTNATGEENLATTPVEEVFESFEQFKLSADVGAAIAEMGFDEPTPVQARAYPAVMKGDDLIVMAQTGTGKTAAFGIPLVEQCDANGKPAQAMVLAPTRELALQVSREIDIIGKKKGIRTAAVYGGASFNQQVQEISAGAQIICGTPGRVLDHIRRGTLDFGPLRSLVLDEADEMLSMGFEREISEIIENLPTDRQTLLFSATIPDTIQRLSKRYMRELSVISVSGDAVAAKEISHYVYIISGAGRTRDLSKVLEIERPESAIVFCNTKDETQIVAKHLRNTGYQADWLNSDLSQSERERVMALVREEKIQFLVATDVAARGIDISHLSHVINYTFPESLEVYIHRTGRTGRMGRRGNAISLITPQDIGNLYYLRLTYKIFPIEKQLLDDLSQSQAAEFEKMRSLRTAFKTPVEPDALSFARRVMQDASSEALIAGLLQNYFATGATSAPKEKKNQERGGRRQPKSDTRKAGAEKSNARKADDRKSDDRRDDNRKADSKREAKEQQKPEPKDKPARPSREETTPRSAQPSRPDSPFDKETYVPAPASSTVDDNDPPKDPSRKKEVYLDGGRKDGLRISSIIRTIVEQADVPRECIGRIRLMSRSTFVAVEDEFFDAVLRGLDNAEIDGHSVRAEPAK